MKKFLEQILAIYAKWTLKLNKPKLVGITGSVGKTSTKEAVALVLGTKFSIRASPGNLNSSLGLPLAILGFSEAGGSKKDFTTVLKWLKILILGFFKVFQPNYPKILILEMGTDRPGDIAYLLNIVEELDVGIITDIGISHLEFFPNEESLTKEKLTLIKRLPKSSLAILNFDNQKIVEGKNSTKAKIIGYGFSQQANVMISDFQILDSNGTIGANFKIHHQGNVVPFFLPETLGKPVAYAAAAAVATGLNFGINLVSSSQALKNFVPPAGRLRLIAGIKHTRIIDDTYNAAPDSTFAALEALSNIASGRKLAAIGDMAELGSKSEAGHKEVAANIILHQIDIVFLVGPKSKTIKDELIKQKFGGQIHWFSKSSEAGLPIQNTLIESDTILVKGSQAARMEKIVKEIMAEPLKAKDLLIRQSKNWD